MKKFRSIEGLSKVFTTLRNQAAYENRDFSTLPTLNFTGTVKIHGTNAGMRIESSASTSILPQGKDRELSFHSDNADFASYCMTIPSTVVQELYQAFNPSMKGVLTIFGEWAGAGVQNGVGVSNFEKHFIIFAAHVDDKYVQVNKNYKNHQYRIYNIYEIPTYSIDIDFANPGDIEDRLTALTLEVEANCPWAVYRGSNGIGEGIVWHLTDDPCDTTYIFKVKGPLHSVRKSNTKKLATVNVEKVTSVNECVDIILTENRMKQMVEVHKIEIIPENFSQFIKAVSLDCIKEESDVLNANNLIWKDVSPTVIKRCKEWYFAHFNINP